MKPNIVPLGWGETQEPCEGCRYHHVAAETPFGRFLITWKGWKDCPQPTVDETPWGDFFGAFWSVDEAKAAAEAEFARRIHACLGG